MKDRNLPENNDWATPDFVYERLNNIFKFDFDPCPFMHDLTKWDGLKVDWGLSNYVNPPYSRPLKDQFISRAYELTTKSESVSCLVLPASVSSIVYHEIIKPNAHILESTYGRIPFVGVNIKGQRVNWHLRKEFASRVDDTCISHKGKQIPLYVKNSGQQDNIIVVFDNRARKVSKLIDLSKILK